jgi:hypothetical protein
MPSQHKHPPIPLRLPEGVRARLLAYAGRTGQPVNRILSKATEAYLEDAHVAAHQFEPDASDASDCAVCGMSRAADVHVPMAHSDPESTATCEERKELPCP